MIANAPFKKRNFKPQDFMPGEKKQQGRLPTLEEMRLMNIAAGGDDIAQGEEPKTNIEKEIKGLSMKDAMAKIAELEGTENGRGS